MSAAQRTAASLQQSGLAPLGRLLPSDHCRALVQYFSERTVADPYRPNAQSFLPLVAGRHPESHIAHHSAADIVRAPGLLALANDPRILQSVSHFLGCKPSLAYLAVWWSYPTSLGAQQAEHFHRDVDDWRFVKLFVYLTDVDDDSGPHIYVTHSSRSPQFRKIRRLTDAEVVDAFGSNNVITMKASAGEGFLEDTFGIHKGQPVRKGHRLLFQAVYSLFPLPYGPTAPVISYEEALPLAGDVSLDRWVNRFYVRS